MLHPLPGDVPDPPPVELDELLPVTWRQINDYGITIDYRTYDSPDLNPWRRQPSGVAGKANRWEVHYDPYDVTRVFVRTPGG